MYPAHQAKAVALEPGLGVRAEFHRDLEPGIRECAVGIYVVLGGDVMVVLLDKEFCVCEGRASFLG